MRMESFTVHITFLENSPKQLKELGSCFKTERKPLNASTQLVDSIELKYAGRAVWSHIGFFFCCFVSHFKTSLLLLQRFKRKPQHCFAVKLQKCFVDYKTTPDFPLASARWVDNDWIFIFRWTVPNNLHEVIESNNAAQLNKRQQASTKKWPHVCWLIRGKQRGTPWRRIMVSLSVLTGRVMPHRQQIHHQAS